MSDDDLLAEPSPARALWLVTLADLALLLVGFFVLLQANQQLDPRALAAGLAEGFGAAPPAAMPVASQGVAGFAPGSAALAAAPRGLTVWALAELRDPRVTLTVTGATDGTAADVDPASRSATLLAADRARSVAALLTAAGVPDARLGLATAVRPGRRQVLVTLAFAGEQGTTR